MKVGLWCAAGGAWRAGRGAGRAVLPGGRRGARGRPALRTLRHLPPRERLRGQEVPPQLVDYKPLYFISTTECRPVTKVTNFETLTNVK